MKIAKTVGCHPNTVRLYEQWGFISPVPRTPKGYRLFTPEHLSQMVLARTALNSGFPGKAIRRSALNLVYITAQKDYPIALKTAREHLNLVKKELAQAENAIQTVEGWIRIKENPNLESNFSISQTAAQLEISVDTLRNWERSGLIRIPRNPINRYRQYSNEEFTRLKVIRMLRKAGYSTMAILRMLIQLDEGNSSDLRQTLDNPSPDEDIFYASDRWLSTLKDQLVRAETMVSMIQNLLESTLHRN